MSRQDTVKLLWRELLRIPVRYLHTGRHRAEVAHHRLQKQPKPEPTWNEVTGSWLGTWSTSSP